MGSIMRAECHQRRCYGSISLAASCTVHTRGCCQNWLQQTIPLLALHGLRATTAEWWHWPATFHTSLKQVNLNLMLLFWCLHPVLEERGTSGNCSADESCQTRCTAVVLLLPHRV
jgi:hypothetical protein